MHTILFPNSNRMDVGQKRMVKNLSCRHFLSKKKNLSCRDISHMALTASWLYMWGEDIS